jgi:coenzyme F420-reducing hydrogenase delta subunit
MNAKKKVGNIKRLLLEVNIDPKRLEMFNLSAAMGPLWAEICTNFTQIIKDLGPSPIWLADQKGKQG